MGGGIREPAKALEGVSSAGARFVETAAREALASGPRPVAAALALVEELAARERLWEALVVVEAASKRAPDRIELLVARARILLDLDRVEEAAELLRKLWVRVRHPRLAFLLARAERALGRFASARRALAEVEGSPHPWAARHAGVVADLRRVVAMEQRLGRRVRLETWEVMARLRGGRQPLERVHALRALAGVPEWAERALRVAATDPDPVVRVAAVRRGPPAGEPPARWLEPFLRDEAPAVRGAAARRLAELQGPGAAPRLLRFLRRETDSYAFARGHEALALLCPQTRVRLPLEGARDPEIRERVCARWEAVWAR